MVDGLSESFSVLDKCDTNCERTIYFYMIDSPETSGNLLEGILENLGILGTWLTWVTRTGIPSLVAELYFMHFKKDSIKW